MATSAAAAPAAAAPAAAATVREEVEVIDLLDDDGSPERVASSRGAGPSNQRAMPASRRAQRRQAAAAAGAGGSRDVVDLTAAGAEPEVQIMRSTVQRAPMRGVKRPRGTFAGAAPSPGAQLSPMKALLQQLRAPAAPPPPPQPEPEGPKCGICMEAQGDRLEFRAALQAMGGANGLPMASGSCGHVYCYDCLLGAVRTQKKCPTCRKSMQQRQIHKVFLSFS